MDKPNPKIQKMANKSHFKRVLRDQDSNLEPIDYT